jgi:predicted nucleic acid-binding Zn ribbon protein
LQSTDIYDNQTGLMSRGEVKRINESYFIIEIPYDSSEKEIQITDLNGNVIAKKSVIEFSRNFNYDEYKEDSVKNKSDSDNIDANGACKDNCIEISNINKNKNLSIITIIILIVVLIGLFYYLFKSLAKGKK